MDLAAYYNNVFYQSGGHTTYQQQQHVFPSQAVDNINNPISPVSDYSSCASSPTNTAFPSPDPTSPFQLQNPTSMFDNSFPSPTCQTSSSSPTSQFTFSSEPEEGHTRRRELKMPRIPSLEILQRRRLAANARERKRMNKINSAFDRLKNVLPGAKEKELSKFESLQLAQDYIIRLAMSLQYPVHLD